MVTPGAPNHSLLPGLMETQVGRVNEATQDEVSEVSDEIIKGHPGGMGGGGRDEVDKWKIVIIETTSDDVPVCPVCPLRCRLSQKLLNTSTTSMIFGI